VQPGRASTAAVQSNLISPAIGQSTRNTRRRNRSWSGSLFHTGLMLLFMFISITATEGFKDWSEITPQMYTPDCNPHPQMPIYMMSGKLLFPSRAIEWNLIRNQRVCNIREAYVHRARDTNRVGVCLQGKLSILEDLHQGVCNIMERYVRQVLDANLAVVCLQGKLAILEDLHHQPKVRGLRARCAHQQQPGVKGYDVALQLLDVIKSVPGAGYVGRDKPGIIDYDVAHRPVDISNAAVLEPG